MKAFMNDPNNKNDSEDNKKKFSKNKRMCYSIKPNNVYKIDVKRMTENNNNNNNNKGDENNRRNNKNDK